MVHVFEDHEIIEEKITFLPNRFSFIAVTVPFSDRKVPYNLLYLIFVYKIPFSLI